MVSLFDFQIWIAVIHLQSYNREHTDSLQSS